MFNFRGIVYLSNNSFEEEFFIEKESSRDLIVTIVDYVLDFAAKNGGTFDCDSIDWIEEDTEEDLDNRVYLKFIDSNYYQENDFYLQYDDYMKALDRGR